MIKLSTVLQKTVEFKDFSRLLSDFPVLFKADLIFKDFSRQSYIFKYFSSLCEPCTTDSHDTEQNRAASMVVKVYKFP